MHNLCIDPGIAGTGWALFDHKWNLQDHGNIHSKQMCWENKIEDILKQLQTISFGLPFKIYIEFPAKFSGVKGDMVAGKGDLVKLTYFVGILIGRFTATKKWCKSWELIEVVKWKGQMPKEAVIKRIKRIYSKKVLKKEITNHAWDAVGLGLYLKGDF